MLSLIEKEYDINNKISKPDFSTKTGREFLAFYLQTKFKQILAYDKKSEKPIFKSIKPDFIAKFTKRIINNPDKRILIGICGESASGKTTICKRIRKSIAKFNMPVSIISADNYFKDISDLIKHYGSFDKLMEAGYDLDSPKNFNLEQLKEDLLVLAQGQDTLLPNYVPDGTGVSIPKSVPAKSQKIIVVEGMASMYGDVPEVFDVNVFVDIDDETQKSWYLGRATERNQTEENALKQFEYIKKVAQVYIQPKKSQADVIINATSSLDYFEQILEYMHAITNNFQSE